VLVLKSRLLIVPGVLVIAACSEQPRRVGVWAGPTGANIARMAATEINFNGGVAGRRLVARVVAQQAVSFSELTQETLRLSLDSISRDTTVVAVITRMTDTITEAAARRWESIGMPYLVTTPVSDQYAKTHPNAFLLVPTIEEQAEFLAEQALQEPQPRRVALLNVREPHAESMTAAIVRELDARGIKPVYSTSFSQAADEFNLTAKAAELATHTPTILYFIGRSPSLFVMHGTIRNKLPNIRLLGSDMVESFHVYGNPGWKYTGLRFVRYFDPLSNTDSAVAKLRDRFWGWVGRNELNSEAGITFDAIGALAHAMQAGAVTRTGLAEALRASLDYKGVVGPVRFGPERRVRRTMYLAEVRMDSIVTVGSNITKGIAKR
jgi:ABC-type branched-subunit amino acid transport system substrate-binding protein